MDKKTEEAVREIQPKDYSLTTVSELYNMQFPEVEWLVDGLIPYDALIALSGDPASFKTWIALHLMNCIANNKKAFDYFDTSFGNVLYIDEENALRILQDRFFKLQIDDTGGRIKLLHQKGILLDKDDDFEAVKKILDDNNINLVIIDSFIRIHSKDENDSTQIAKINSKLRKLTAKNRSVLYTHHNRKASIFGKSNLAQSMRGSSDILASIDIHLSVRKSEEKLIISQTKNRVREEIKPFTVGLDKGDDYLFLKYEGEHDENKTKTEEAKEAILEIINESNKEFVRDDFYEALRGLYGEKLINDSLADLLKNELISCRIGERGKHIYLAKNNNNLV